MATIAPQEILKAWKQADMPMEMTLGHVVQNLVILREDIDRLLVHTKLPPNPKSKQKLPKSGEPPKPKQPS